MDIASDKTSSEKKLILEGNRLTITETFALQDIPSLKKILKEKHAQIHSVYPAVDLSISMLYMLKKYLHHNNIEVPEKYREDWTMLQTKLPTVEPVTSDESSFNALKKSIGLFSLEPNDPYQNEFWWDMFEKSFVNLVIDNASIVFLLFFGIGVTLTFLSYTSLYEYGIEMDSIKVAMIFGLKVLCPMMSVVLLSAKSCTAQSAIIKTMSINGDFKVMNIINLPYTRVYLHPIFVACIIAGPLVNIVAIVGTMVGCFTSWIAKGHPIDLFFSILGTEFYMQYVFNSELRAILASTFTGFCMCFAGLVPGRDFQSLIRVISTCITLSFIANIFSQTIVSLF